MQLRNYLTHTFSQSDYFQRLSLKEQHRFQALGNIFHFKANNYVLDHLINWDDLANDPIYRMVFPRVEMLNSQDADFLETFLKHNPPPDTISQFAKRLRPSVAPTLVSTPASIPHLEGKQIQGMYQNFPTIVSLFPSPMAKTCHTYCNYCFRGNMFNDPGLQQDSCYQAPLTPVAWLKENPQVTDVLFTGADPLVLNAETLKKYIEPILNIDSVQVIRLSSKALSWWPFRFTSDKDAPHLLDLFRWIKSKGKHVNFCAHFTHPREMEHPEVGKATERILSTGAMIRTQGPLIAGVNDSAEAWSQLWSKQLHLGMVPYYMFMEADHLPSSCFRVPFDKALDIFQKAQAMTSGLARTVRGPVFMNDLNRILLDGIVEIEGKSFFVLKTLQAPPGSNSEGNLRLLPYRKDQKVAPNLFQLFNSPSLV